MVMRMRARKEEDKLARREAILNVVSQSLGRRQFASVTMAEIAASCGLAKGTLYLYFSTKEELFLAALEVELASWLDAIANELAGQGRIDPQTYASVVSRTLAPRETLTELLPLMRTMLEQTATSETSNRFRHMLHDKLESVAVIVERALPLSPGDGVRLLLRTLALVVGLRQIPDPHAVGNGTNGNGTNGNGTNGAAAARLAYDEELVDALIGMVRGMLAAHG